MWNYILRKIAYGSLVLFAVTVIVSVIINLSPVDPASLTFGQRLDEETLKSKKEQLGLDLPIYRQVALYLKDIAPVYVGPSKNWSENYSGKSITLGAYRIGVKAPYLRESYQSGQKVSSILLNAFPNTLYLACLAIGLATILGLFLGTISALSKGTWLDHSIIFFSTLGFSVPSYVTAIVLAVIFGYYLNSVTGLNIQGSLYELNDFGDEVLVLKNLILPAIALGIRPVAIVTQLMRSSMLRISKEQFVLSAKAKGLSQKKIVIHHTLRNALNPVITALTGWFAALLAGAFFVEFIFNYKGLGFVTVMALLNYDIPVVLGALLLTCTLFIFINILVDITYALLDPRVKLHN